MLVIEGSKPESASMVSTRPALAAAVSPNSRPLRSECRWMQNWPHTEINTDGASTEAGGRWGASFGNGCANETKRKSAAVPSPEVVACTSDMRTPRRCTTERAYAETRQLSARILNICVVVTSVQRPWVMMSMHEDTLADLDVKAAAIEASPSLTAGSVIISRCKRSSSRFCCFSRAEAVPAASPLAPPPFLRLRRRLEPPPSGSSASSAAGGGGGGGGTSEVVTSATLTAARLRAPTSLVPSPHMRATTPLSRCVARASSFCPGLMRASTRRCGSAAGRAPAACRAAKPAPSKHRSYLRASARKASALNSSIGSAGSDADAHHGRHRNRGGGGAAALTVPLAAAAVDVAAAFGTRVSSSSSRGGRHEMPSVWAACVAVSSASPVSIWSSWPEVRSCSSTACDSGLFGQCSTSSPRNVRPDSTASRASLVTSAPGASAVLISACSLLDARASTRLPSRVCA